MNLKKIPSVIMWALAGLAAAVAAIFVRASAQTRESEVATEIEISNEKKLNTQHELENKFHDKMDEVEELLKEPVKKDSEDFGAAVNRWRETDVEPDGGNADTDHPKS